LSRRERKALTPIELKIMKVLWRIGPATVQRVREEMDADPRPAYTTVQTMLNVLLRKGRVRRTLKGQAYQYSSAMSRQSAISVAVRDLVNSIFEGSAEDLVMSLVRSKQLTAEKLAELTRIVEQSGRSTKESRGGK
jgi:predicted transcriptional regulator